MMFSPMSSPGRGGSTTLLGSYKHALSPGSSAQGAPNSKMGRQEGGAAGNQEIMSFLRGMEARLDEKFGQIHGILNQHESRLRVMEQNQTQTGNRMHMGEKHNAYALGLLAMIFTASSSPYYHGRQLKQMVRGLDVKAFLAGLSLRHISEPTLLRRLSYAVFRFI